MIIGAVIAIVTHPNIVIGVILIVEVHFKATKTLRIKT